MAWRFLLVTVVALSACGIELRDTPGRACDDTHPCRAPRSCVLGVCEDPPAMTGGGGAMGGGGGVSGGGGGGGGTGFDAGMSDAGMPRWQQKLHGFTATQVEPGCMLDIDPLRGSRVQATIRSSRDIEDTAFGLVSDRNRMPRGIDGRLRGRVTFAAPLNVVGFVPVATITNDAGLAFVRVGFDESGQLRVDSDPNTVASNAISERFSVAGGFQTGDYIIDVMWRAGVVRQVRINDAL
ncbi:MAG: hypothetical protein JNM17_18755, partial [Archangium sp.]|nr:hypothetical protein [Archangium sp.]